MFYLIHPFIFALANLNFNCYYKSSLVVNIINHTLLSIYSFIVYSKKDANDTEMLFCGEWLLSYMIYDLIVMLVLKKQKSFVYTVHHLFAIVLLHGLMATGRYYEYFPVICLFEVSSIPLNIRYLLRQYNVPNNSIIILMSEIVFIMLFIMIRFVFGGRHVAAVWSELDSTNFFDMLLMIIITIFGMMHVYWLVSIINKKINQMVKKII